MSGNSDYCYSFTMLFPDTCLDLFRLRSLLFPSSFYYANPPPLPSLPPSRRDALPHLHSPAPSPPLMTLWLTPRCSGRYETTRARRTYPGRSGTRGTPCSSPRASSPRPTSSGRAPRFSISKVFFIFVIIRGHFLSYFFFFEAICFTGVTMREIFYDIYSTLWNVL